MNFQTGMVAAMVAVTLIACAQSRSELEQVEVAVLTSNLIVDGANNDGNEHFFFLPPMVRQPRTRGRFDRDQNPVVTICTLVDGACGTTVATFSRDEGSVKVRGNRYYAWWKTFQLPHVDRDYRVTVTANGQELGLADVAVRTRWWKLWSIDHREYVPLRWGMPLPIRFRIEEGAVDTAVDECAEGTDNCSVNAQCTDAQDGFVCTCDVGYQGDGVSCADVDECDLGVDDCGDNATCTNTPGSFQCICDAGFTETNTGCVDVDECATASICGADSTCVNRPGTYECQCESELDLDFDEGGGTLAFDTSGNGRHAVLDGAGWSVDTPDGSASSLDATAGRATITPVVIQGDQLTLSAWIKPNTLSNEGRIISSAQGTGTNDHFFMLSAIQTDKVRFRLAAGGSVATLVSSNGLPTGVWTHVAATYDGTAMRIYVNGVEDGSLAKTGALEFSSDETVAIGDQSRGAGDRPFDGLIDAVFVDARVLSPSDIATLASGAALSCEYQPACEGGAVCGDGVACATEACDDGNVVDDDACSNTCVAATCYDGLQNQGEAGVDCGGPCIACGEDALLKLTCNEGSGSIYYDSGAYGRHGTKVGASWSNDTPDGSAYAASFADGGRISLPTFDVTGDQLTILMWVKDAGTTNRGQLIAKASNIGLDGSFAVTEYNNDTLRFRVRTSDGSTAILTSSISVPVGVWTHVAAVYDGQDMRLYIDGVLDSTTLKSGMLQPASAIPVAIGNQAPGGGSLPYDGLLDGVRVYERAWSPSEIADDATL